MKIEDVSQGGVPESAIPCPRLFDEREGRRNPSGIEKETGGLTALRASSLQNERQLRTLAWQDVYAVIEDSQRLWHCWGIWRPPGRPDDCRRSKAARAVASGDHGAGVTRRADAAVSEAAERRPARVVGRCIGRRDGVWWERGEGTRCLKGGVQDEGGHR